MRSMHVYLRTMRRMHNTIICLCIHYLCALEINIVVGTRLRTNIIWPIFLLRLVTLFVLPLSINVHTQWCSCVCACRGRVFVSVRFHRLIGRVSVRKCDAFSVFLLILSIFHSSWLRTSHTHAFSFFDAGAYCAKTILTIMKSKLFCFILYLILMGLLVVHQNMSMYWTKTLTDASLLKGHTSTKRKRISGHTNARKCLPRIHLSDVRTHWMLYIYITNTY